MKILQQVTVHLLNVAQTGWYTKETNYFTLIVFKCIIFRTYVLRNLKSKVCHFRYGKVVLITTKKKKKRLTNF